MDELTQKAIETLAGELGPVLNGQIGATVRSCADAAMAPVQERISGVEANLQQARSQAEALAAKFDGLNDQLPALVGETQEKVGKVLTGLQHLSEQVESLQTSAAEQTGRLGTISGDMTRMHQDSTDLVARVESTGQENGKRLTSVETQIETASVAGQKTAELCVALGTELARLAKAQQEAEGRNVAVRAQQQYFMFAALVLLVATLVISIIAMTRGGA